jgi:hypothetical protein
MILLRYLLILTGIALLTGAAAILAWDLYQILKPRKQPGEPVAPLRWQPARQLAVCSILPLLAGLSIAVIPSGSAAVRVNQFAGTRPATLYPGVHWMIPLIEQPELYSIRDNIFTTATLDRVWNDGKFFFANDVLKGTTTPAIVH